MSTIAQPVSSPRVNGSSPVYVLEEATRNKFYKNRLEADICKHFQLAAAAFPKLSSDKEGPK